MTIIKSKITQRQESLAYSLAQTYLLRETMIDLIGKLVHLSVLAVGLATRTGYLDAMALQNGSFWL